MDVPHDITLLLHNVRSGAPESADALYRLVYDELRRIAHLRLRHERKDHTLNTTALVHEAYLRMIGPQQVDWQDRAHFFALAARAMRFVLVDYARRRMAARRGGGQEAVPLESIQVAADERAADVLALDEALTRLDRHDERLARVIEYRFFTGLTYEEIGAVTGQSVTTVKRDWRRARAWLYEMMQPSS